jgi:hypothetical protein
MPAHGPMRRKFRNRAPLCPCPRPGRRATAVASCCSIRSARLARREPPSTRPGLPARRARNRLSNLQAKPLRGRTLADALSASTAGSDGRIVVAAANYAGLNVDWWICRIAVGTALARRGGPGSRAQSPTRIPLQVALGALAAGRAVCAVAR